MHSADAELWTAARTVEMHAAGEGCGQCQPDGCRLHQWADARLRRWEQETGQAYPDAEPAWSSVARPG